MASLRFLCRGRGGRFGWMVCMFTNRTCLNQHTLDHFMVRLGLLCRGGRFGWMVYMFSNRTCLNQHTLDHFMISLRFLRRGRGGRCVWSVCMTVSIGHRK